MSTVQELTAQVAAQGERIRALKQDKSNAKDVIDKEVAILKDLKTKLSQLEAQEAAAAGPKAPVFDRLKFEELLKKRFFYYPSFSIYGGVAGLYDYGPPGCGLQANMLSLWRTHFVLEENMLELDCTILTPHDVLKTSGHVDRFTDFMVKDLKPGDFYRADHLLEAKLKTLLQDKAITPEKAKELESVKAQVDAYSQEELGAMLRKYDVKSPDGNNDVSDPVSFNLMFGTSIGPTGLLKGYLRPETAQGQFVNFKKLLECNNDKMPFASALIGRSFRNEISPRAGLLRVREFTMAEIEHYVHPDKKDHPSFASVSNVELNLFPADYQVAGRTDFLRITIGEAVSKKIVDNQTLGYFLVRTMQYLHKIGVKPNKLRFRQHLKNEMAHYASDCWDAEIESSYGWVECVGCADRSAYDLTCHTQRTRESLMAREALPEPIRETHTRVFVDKKEVGVAFRKDAKAILAYFDGLSEADIVKVRTELESSADGNIKIQIEGNEFVIGKKMLQIKDVEETIHVREYIPNVIEPSFGIGRIMYSLLEHSYYSREGDEQRQVLGLPALVAPTKVLVAPLSGHESFAADVKAIAKDMRKQELSVSVDESSTSIGKRYARHDEIGVPFGVVVDFQTAKDRTVTVRERDSCKQVRVPISEVAKVVKSMCTEELSWADVMSKYPEFLAQELDN